MFLLKQKSFLQTICSSCKNYQNLMKFSVLTTKRNLPDSYFCNESWDSFLTSEVMNKIDLSTFSAEIDDKLTRKQIVTPLDMDILAAKTVYADSVEQLEFIENIFFRFRQTQPALFVKDSMHHAFVRSYIDLGQTDRLLNIFVQKYKYGIFVDNYTANLLMSAYLKEKNYLNSSGVAIEVMLQESNDNQLTLSLCLLSCWKYYESIKGLPSQLNDDQTANDDENVKVEKVLVNYLRNPYFDDHFDIKNYRHLIGKTIYFSSSNLKIDSSILIDSLKIQGLIIHEKYSKAVDLLKQIETEKKKISKSVLDELDNKLKNYSSTDDKQKVEQEKLLKKYQEINIEKIKSNESIDITKQLESMVENLITKYIDIDIKAQKELFQKWSNEQKEELKKQIKNFLIEEKKKSILQRLESLERQEEILTFFDNKDKIKITYYNKGFPRENPTDIPLPDEQKEFDALFERHFKNWKKKIKPKITLSNNKRIRDASLNKLYNSTTNTAV